MSKQSWFGLPLPGPATTEPTITTASATALLSPLPGPATEHESLQGNRLHALVEKICDFSFQSRRAGDQFWGRHPGSPHTNAATEFIVAELEAAGVEILGKHESAYIRNNFPQQWALTLQAPTEAADWPDIVLASAIPIEKLDGTDRAAGNISSEINITAQPRTDKTWVQAPLVHLGDGSEISLVGKDLTGKVAVFHYEPNPSWFYSDLDQKIQRLVEAGAAGVVVAHTMPGNSQQIAGRISPEVSGFHLGGEDGAFLEAVLVQQALNGGGELTMTLEATHVSGVQNSSTAVMGRIRGRRSDQNIILSAHTDAFFTGANDNASGLAVMVGLAGTFGGNKSPACDLYFFISPGHHEPTGGMAAITEHYVDVAKTSVMAVNLEHIAQGGYYRSIFQRQTDRYGNSAPGWVQTTADSVGREVSLWPASDLVARLWDDSAHEVGLVAPRTTGTPAIAEPMALMATDTPAIQCVETGTWFHSSADSPSTIVPETLQRSAVFFYNFIQRLGQLERTDIWQSINKQPHLQEQS